MVNTNPYLPCFLSNIEKTTHNPRLAPGQKYLFPQLLSTALVTPGRWKNRYGRVIFFFFLLPTQLKVENQWVSSLFLPPELSLLELRTCWRQGEKCTCWNETNLVWKPNFHLPVRPIWADYFTFLSLSFPLRKGNSYAYTEGFLKISILK